MLEALAAYANMGDTPEDWQRFRLMYPDFFPSAPSQISWAGFRNLTEWMYAFADVWEKNFADLPSDRRPLPPLLWYRNRLRAIWARNDQHGYSLAVLLGFEKEAKKILAEHPGEIPYDIIARPLAIPGQHFIPDKQESEGLPQGRPIINGVTGEIRWEFGCEMQQAVYELMQNRWRAKVCPTCGRFFIAGKNAQNFCSIPCSSERKRERSRMWWNAEGSKKRSKAKARKK